MANSDKKRPRDSGVSSEAGEPATTSNPPSKKARVDKNRSLFVRSLPPSATSESLTNFFSQYYPIKHATVVLDPKTKTSRGYGFVSFADPEDAVEAKEKLNNESFDGRKLRLDLAQPRLRDATKSTPAVASKAVADKRKREEEMAEARKAPKLIIRNLPWSIKSSDQLAKLFQSFGKVKYADLPNAKGKMSGFGFVTLRGRKNAEKALEAINGKEIDGRTVAVDWAVDKQTWDEQQDKEPREDGDDDDDNGKAAKKKAKKAKKEGKEEIDDPNMTQEDRDLANFFKNYGDNLEDEVESDEDEDEAEDDEDEDEDEDDNDDDDELDSEVDDMGDLEDEEEEEEEEEETEAPKRTTDNSLTVFVRNLPYTATDEQLKALFENFGAVRYARVVKERGTDRPAGTGFVCFYSAEDMRTCLKGAPRHLPPPTPGKHSVLQDETLDPDGKYTMEGRVLQVAKAVNKDEATRLAETSKTKKDKDKRRLFLLSEGQIPASSPLFRQMSDAEIKMREASAKQRKKLIESNPALHLSLTRLAVRNIPSNMDSKALKALAREAVVGFAKDVKAGLRAPISKEENMRGGEQDKEAEHRRKEKRKGVVSQAKIVFETAQGSKVEEKTEAGKSRGYGFIEYSSHRWALMGLRYLNGHALKNAAGKNQRLIVEFAIENANVVQRRRQHEEKIRIEGPRAPGSRAAREAREAERKKNRGKGKREEERPAKRANWNQSTKGKQSAKPAEEKPKDKKDEKLAMRTKIVARKREMRKKKTAIRSGGKP